MPSLSHACRCRRGYTPLHLSARDGHAEVAKLLVHAKSDVASRTRFGECARRALLLCQPHARRCSDGSTPLTISIDNYRFDVAAFLRSVGAPE
jgi:hypothetical protein